MTKLIKKYNNRKLYDTETSKYITVSSLLTMPVGSFRVVQHEDQQDVTDQVLFSALFGYFSDNPGALKANRDQLVAMVADQLKVN